MIWLVIIMLIVCATILIGMYLYYADSNMSGCFSSDYKTANNADLEDLKEQYQQIIKEIQELKDIVKEQNSFSGFTIQK